MNQAMDTELYQEEYIPEYNLHKQNLLAKNRFYLHRKKNILKLVEPHPGECIVDLGCGIGTVSFFLAEQRSRVIGVDVSKVAIDYAQKIAREYTLTPPRFVVAEVTALPFKPNIVDKVIAADFTEHLDEATLKNMLQECKAALLDKGKLSIYTPSPTHIFELLKKRNIFIKDDPTHIGLLSLQRLKDIVTATGFSISRAFFSTTHIPVFKIIERVLCLVPIVGQLFKRRICMVAEKKS